jgi:hypothetical protein
MNQCCALGMVPLTLESADKNTCLNKMISTKIDFDESGDLIIGYKIGMEWQHNWNYWTSGRKSGASFEYCFGTSSQARHLPLPSSYWAPTQPNNTDSEQCVHMGISKLLKVAQLHDKNCAQKFMSACQVSN